MRTQAAASEGFGRALTFAAIVTVSGACYSAPLKGTPTFQLVTAVAEKGASKLVNGHIVKPEDWPALVTAVIGFELVAGEDVPIRCSGALIGPGVLLTAAHCLDYGNDQPLRSELNIEVRPKERRKLICSASPEYRTATNVGEVPRVAQDYALCAYDSSDLNPQTLPLYEVVDLASVPQPQDRVLMTGWGCRDLTFSGGRWIARSVESPSLAIADTQITAAPVLSGAFEDQFLSIVSNVTDAGKEPALCKGDSGGPLMVGATLAQPNGPRRVAGVNSWFGPYKTSNSKVRSGIAPLGDGLFRAFAISWLKSSTGASICGLKDAATPPATHCRP